MEPIGVDRATTNNQGVPEPLQRVWIYDHDPIFRLGMVMCLRDAGFVVVADSDTVPEPCGQRQGDVVMFALESAALAQAVRLDLEIGLRLVAVADNADESIVPEAINAGVTGLIIRHDATPHCVAQCLRAVAAGHAAIPARLVAALMTQTSASGGFIRRGDLSDRELSVLRLLAQGQTTRAIADRMHYSEKTIKTVIRDVMVRSGCRNRSEAVALATRCGVI
jgi:DNA-binding NarL/FixJ family response regulator